MLIQVLKSKLHLATVTDACVDYEGSMTISKDLMDQAGMVPYEKILCGNMANGQRFETYIIPGEAGRGEIILNGATATLGSARSPHHHDLHSSSRIRKHWPAAIRGRAG